MVLHEPDIALHLLNWCYIEPVWALMSLNEYCCDSSEFMIIECIETTVRLVALKYYGFAKSGLPSSHADWCYWTKDVAFEGQFADTKVSASSVD